MKNVRNIHAYSKCPIKPRVDSGIAAKVSYHIRSKYLRKIQTINSRFFVAIYENVIIKNIK